MTDDFVLVPFSPSRGVPQSATVDLGGRRFTVTLAAVLTDVPALRATSATTVLVDAGAEQRARPVEVVGDARAMMRAAPHATLSPKVVRPVLAVREDVRRLGVRHVVCGRTLSFGSDEASPLAVEAVVDELRLTAGTVTRPGDTGAVIQVRVRLATRGVVRNEQPPLIEEDPFAALT